MERNFRILTLLILDALLINFAYFIAILIRFDFTLTQEYIDIYINNAVVVTIIKILVFYYFKLYKSLWRYASIEELVQVIVAVVLSNASVISYLIFKQVHLPRSIYLLLMMLDVILIGGVRFSYRALRRVKNSGIINKDKKRIMIIGAGDAGAMIIKELKNNNELNSVPIAVIDDDNSKEGRRINGVPVLGQRCDIYSIATKKDIDEIVIAIPSAHKNDISEIIEECKKTRCKTKMLPGVFELIDGQVDINKLRDVSIEDLLGRDEVSLDTDGISDFIENKTILVTGGGGSIGSELCRQIVQFKPSELIILDIYENNVYDLINELSRKSEGEIKIDNGYLDNENQNIIVRPIIASVRDKARIFEIIERFKPDVVFHAAAHKHVPLMEYNPKESIKNNVFGTLNVTEACDKYNIEKFVLISTDKAVNPTNIMGASKRMCEMIVQSIDKVSETEFVAVRFGNVLGSNGSVIPLFKRQIAEGGPVTVTHPDIIRYFMTIPEASQLVIQAGAMANGGEIFVLDMGEPVKIIDLAQDLIKLSGYEPYEEMDIKITGLRPGEKLYEELLMNEEGIEKTRHEKIFVGRPIFSDFELFKNQLEDLRYSIVNDCDEDVVHIVEKLVPTFKKSDIEGINKEILEEINKEVASAM